MTLPFPRSWSDFADRTSVQLAVIILTGIIIYSGILNAPFIFDDIYYIQENRALESFLTSGFRSAYEHARGDVLNSMLLRPLVYLTFSAEVLLYGRDRIGFHAVNIAFHLATAASLFFLLRTVCCTPFFRNCSNSGDCRRIMPFAVTLIFVCHPVQIQAVTYIIQRFTSMSALFYLLTLTMYLKARMSTERRTGLLWLAASTVASLLAMFSKETAFTLPLMALLIDMMFLEGPWAQRLKWALPLLLTMLVIPLNTMYVAASTTAASNAGLLERSTGLANLYGNSRWEYLCTQFRVIVTYLRILLFPTDLHLDYDYPRFRSLWTPQVSASLAALAAIAGGALLCFIRSRREVPERLACRLAAFGCFWFFIALSIESSIIPIDDVIFEHRLYLPMIGFFVCLFALLTLALGKISHSPVPADKRAFTVVMLSAILFSGATLLRNHVWTDEVRFWEDNTAKAPQKARPWRHLASAYHDAGRYSDSVAANVKSLELETRPLMKAVTWKNIAILRHKMNQIPEAFAAFEMSLSNNPANVQLREYYAGLLSRHGRTAEARHHTAIAGQMRRENTTAGAGKTGVHPEESGTGYLPR